MKPTLVSRGYGTQEQFGAMFGIGGQAAVGHFLNGRSAISPKAAVAFAKGLDCKVADFSMRLAELLDEDPYSERAPRSAGPHAAAPNLEVSLMQIANALQAAPERVREQIGRELALMASVPDSNTLVHRIATALSPFSSRPGVKRDAPTLANRVSQRLDSIGDERERERLLELVDRVIDREVAHPSDTVTESPPTREREPRS